MTVTDPATLLEKELGATGTFEVPGLGERPLVAPADDAAWQQALAIAREQRWRCLVVGSGSRVGWTNHAERVDVVFSTRATLGDVRYEPGDGTVTARAGTPMDELRAVVAEGGHHLTPDVAGATLSFFLLEYICRFNNFVLDSSFQSDTKP